MCWTLKVSHIPHIVYIVCVLSNQNYLQKFRICISKGHFILSFRAFVVIILLLLLLLLLLLYLLNIPNASHGNERI
jgi:hypothetical protein